MLRTVPIKLPSRRNFGSQNLAPFSYRNDASFKAALALTPNFNDKLPLIIFDGHCVLCASGVSWMMKRDPRGTSQFAAVQTMLPQALYKYYGNVYCVT